VFGSGLKIWRIFVSADIGVVDIRLSRTWISVPYANDWLFSVPYYIDWALSVPYASDWHRISVPCVSDWMSAYYSTRIFWFWLICGYPARISA